MPGKLSFVLLLVLPLAEAFSGTKDYAPLFAAFKLRFNKVYSTAADEAAAFAAFLAAEDKITEHNAKGLSFTLGHNEHSDMSWDDFFVPGVLNELPSALNRSTSAVEWKSPQCCDSVHNATASAPDSVDWVSHGAVTPIKNQGQCGSCWSFAATGAIEGAYFISTGSLLSVSEEDLVQCSYLRTVPPNLGCSGGQSYNAFNWVKSNGIASEAAYPYDSGGGTTGSCDTSKRDKPVVTLSSYVSVGHWSTLWPWGHYENDMLSAVAQQPVAVAIEADKDAFQLYKSGVLDKSDCGTTLDHAVLVVGYGHDAASGKDYWKVKNSWGATWGEEGYVRIVRGSNMCGIGKQPVYPTGVHAYSE